MERESMDFDVVIVGAGPAGLSAAIRLKQLNPELSVCILEKGAEVGAHILSGAVFETRALDELLPNWQQLDAPLNTPATLDEFFYLTKKSAWSLPTPPQMKNDGNYIISLANLCRWLAQQAEQLGVDIYPGFAAADILYDDEGKVIGVATGDMGIGKDGQPTDQHQVGMNLQAKQTLFAEGCRGSLSQRLIKRFQLRKNHQPQSYAIGLKEVWRVSKQHHQPGKVIHTVGWPLDQKTYGGSFIYHFDNQQILLGFVIGLDYQNPWLSPYDELQRFKTHPSIRHIFEDGERIAYGARALNEGGWQSIPDLTFPGGALIGCSAGFLNVPKIKGSHTAMKSGMLAAEAIHESLKSQQDNINRYPEKIKQSWIAEELIAARNIRPAFRWGLWPGLAYAAIDTYLLRGKAPWTFNHHADYKALQPAANMPKIDYPKPDGKLTFDKPSSVYLTNTFHEENQPSHLTLRDKSLAIDVNYHLYQSPESRYCPAGVYEIVFDQEQKPRLQINAQNCIHCKTCDIKDPRQNIVWDTPEGGGGPNYGDM